MLIDETLIKQPNNMMKTFKSILALFLGVLATTAIGQITTPIPSSAGSVGSTVGLTEITIEYSRPKMKGRKIFGEGSDYLQPYGQLWRSGANQGSKLVLSTDANIGGTDVKAGEYLIFSTPGKDSWDVMLYSDISLGGNVNSYDKANEVVMTSVKPTMLSSNVETLTYNISDISEDNTSANIELTWANVSVKVPIKVDFDEAVMKDIEANTVVRPGNYVTAANYFLAMGKDLNKALEWMNTYLAIGQNSDQFWNVHTKAQILKAMGNKKEAIATAMESLEKAKKGANGDFGYIKRNEDLIAEAKKK